MNMRIQAREETNNAVLLTHLILDEKLDSLNGSRSSLGDPGSHSGEHEVLSKSQLLA